MNRDRVSNFYSSSKEFNELLTSAEEADPRDKDADFVAEVRDLYDRWGQGMFITGKQVQKLKRIAGEGDDAESEEEDHGE